MAAKTNQENVLRCVIHESTWVKAGDMLKLRTTNNATINGVFVPKNTFFFAEVRIETNRIHLVVSRLVVNGTILEMATSVRDAVDGREGIHFSGSNVQQNAGESVKNASSEVLSAAGTVGRIGASVLSQQQPNRKVYVTMGKELIIKI